ncbi:unnamed protein product [Closterium sp. Naga37s-1]|nr:unnamed protein product [Closterium sp. Naga37s-1]
MASYAGLPDARSIAIPGLGSDGIGLRPRARPSPCRARPRTSVSPRPLTAKPRPSLNPAAHSSSSNGWDGESGGCGGRRGRDGLRKGVVGGRASGGACRVCGARSCVSGARNEGWCDRELQGEGQGDQGQGGAQVQGEQAWRGEGAHRKASGAADSGSGSEKETGQGERARDGDESEENAHVDNALHDLPASWHWLVGRWARLGVQLSRMRSQWGRLVFGPAAEERIWSVPWQGDTIFQVMFLWFLAFWLIGSWLVPLLAQALGLRRAAMSLRAHALYSLLTDLAEMTVGIAILNRCLTRFQPLPPHWFPVHLSGRWYLQALLACSFFPFVQLLSKLNLQLLPLPLKFQATTHLEQSIHSHDPIATLLYAIAVAVCAPVWEEVVFRGFLLPSLTRYFPLWASVVVTLRLLFCASLVCAPLLVPASAAPGGVRWRDVDVGELGIMPSPLFSFDRAPPVIEGAALPRLGEIGEGAAGEDAGGVAAVNAWLAEQGAQGIGGPDAAVGVSSRAHPQLPRACCDPATSPHSTSLPPLRTFPCPRGGTVPLIQCDACAAYVPSPTPFTPAPLFRSSFPPVPPPPHPPAMLQHVGGPCSCCAMPPPHASQLLCVLPHPPSRLNLPSLPRALTQLKGPGIREARPHSLHLSPLPLPLFPCFNSLSPPSLYPSTLPFPPTHACTHRPTHRRTHACSTGAMLVARQPIAAAAAALLVPAPLQQTADGLAEGEARQLPYNVTRKEKPWTAASVLAAWLLRERAKGAKSKWAAFIGSLPRYAPLPALFEREVVEMLDYPPMMRRLALYRAAFEEEYLRSKAKAIARASKSHFFWALSLVLSRALPLLPYTHMPHGLLPSQLPASAATASPVGKVVAAVRAKERGDDKEDATATAAAATAAAAGGAGAAAGAASEAGAAGSGGSSEGFCSASAGAGEGAASAQGCSAVQQQWVGTSAEELARSMQWVEQWMGAGAGQGRRSRFSAPLLLLPLPGGFIHSHEPNAKLEWQHGTASDPHAPSDSAPPVTIRALSAIPANTRLSLNLGALSNDVLWALHGHLPAANPHDRVPLFHTPDSLLAFLLSLHPLSTPAGSTSGSAAPSQWYDPGLSKEQEAALAAAVEAAEDAVHAEVMAHSSTSSGSGMAGAQQQYPVALSLWDEVDGGAYNAGADGQVEPRLVAALAAVWFKWKHWEVHAPRAPLFSAFSIFILASLFPSLIFPPPLAPSPRAWQPCWPDLDWQQLAQVAVSFSRNPFHPACPPPTASLSIPPHLVAPLSAAAAAIAKRAEQLLWAFSSSPQEDELLLQRLAACRLAPPPHSGPDAAGSVDGSAEREDGAAEVADSSKEAVEEEQGSGQGREGSAGKAGSGTAGAEGCKGVEFDASVCTAQVMRTLGQREMVVRFRLGKKLLLQRLAQRLDSGACIHGVVDGAGEAAAAATATAASS